MRFIGITWVICGGSPVHVSRFAGLPRGRRPAVTCPECGRRLTLKLGRVKRHHAAHAPSAICPVTRPESALHLDAKFHIASQLEAAIGRDAPLVVRRACAGARAEHCDALDERPWAAGWDAVVVEPRAASTGTRPDIVLMRTGQPMAAIEVLVSHAVPDAKAAVLDDAGVPWIEVRATPALIEGDAPWTIERPLVIARDARDPWRCDVHAAAHRVHMERVAADRAREADAERRQVVLRGARVVDVYGTLGRHERLIYRLEEELYDWRVHALVLRCGGREVAREPASDVRGSRRRAWQIVRAECDVDVGAAIRRLTDGHLGRGFSDSPMRWASGDNAANLVHEALSDMSPDGTPLATRYPRRWFYNREQERWFLPETMRNVTWDRPDPDAFAAHPAHAANRARVRERPVPEHAWKTFALANRPTVAAFGAAASSVLEAARGYLAEVANLTVMVPEPGRVLALLTGPISDSDLLKVAGALEALGADHLWLSHPRDWKSERAYLAWAPAGRDERGRGVVIVDGVGVYGAEQFARLYGRGDRRLTVTAIRKASAERVAALSRPLG